MFAISVMLFVSVVFLVFVDVVDVRDAPHPRLDRARQRLRSLQNRHK